MKIIVDHRERSSGIIRELARRHFDLEVRQLAAGDFVFVTTDHDGQEKLIGIEKKTQSDFLNSIIDNRLLGQLLAMKEQYHQQLLILEGGENIYTLRNFHPNAIRGMLASIALDLGIPIIPTKNYRDTVLLLEVIAKRFEKPSKPISLLAKPKPPTLQEQQRYIVESFPLIGPQLAEALLEKFGSIKAIVQASAEELQEVEKIGSVKAKKLVELFALAYAPPAEN